MSALAGGDGMLFVHGAGGRGLVWQHQMLAFPRSQAPDLPGRSGAAPSGVDGYVESLRAALLRRRRVLAGHSLGGAIALRWALSYPDEVLGLVLVGTGARLRVNPVWLAGLRGRDIAVIEEFGSWWFGPSADAHLKEKSLALLRATPPAVLLQDLAAADGFDVMADLARISVPALIICGAEDRLAPVKFSRYLREHIPGSDLVVVEDAGHMVMLEQPRATNTAIGAFLSRLEEGVGT